MQADVIAGTERGAYRPPVEPLLRLGSPDRCEPPIDYRELGFGPEHIPELIRMATDDTLNNGDPESREIWAPMHAWRVLGLLRAEEAVVPLLGLLRRVDENGDDWVADDLPDTLAEIGPAMLPPTAGYLADSTHGDWARVAAANAIHALGQGHPERRAECVDILARQLEPFADQSESLNGSLVSFLLDLKAVEAATVMEKAFAAGRVDEMCAGDWEDVQIDLGLKVARETPRKPNKLTELADKIRARFGLGEDEPEPFFVGFPPEGEGVLHFSEGARAGQIWKADLWCCSDPMCGCWYVNFECRPDGGEESDALSFSLDASTRKLVDPPADEPVDVKAREFARCVVDAFREKDWDRLADYLEEDKQMLMECMEISELAGRFPEPLIGADLAGYQDVFPFALPFFFAHEGIEWAASDSYCLDPKCSCHDVFFAIVRLDERNSGQEADPEAGILVRYDYRTGHDALVHSGKIDAPPVKTLMARLKAEYPELRQIVSGRHSDLRFLNKRAMHARGDGQPALRAAAKVGRNDPCPCGSGKKYKKCCGK